VSTLLLSTYNAIVPRRLREAVYRQRHAERYRQLRTSVFPSPKGTFSLRRYDEMKAIFVHTPKAAGTSVAISIFGELPYHYTALEYRTIFGAADFGRYFKFTFVRNPWDRVLSAYSYLQRGGWNESDRQWAATNLAQYTSFEHFVLNGLPRSDIRSFMHFRPQEEFVCDWLGRPLVDFVGRFERLAEDFTDICGRIGVSAELQQTNPSDHLNYKDAFSRQMVAVVRRHYRSDIDLFRYDF